MTIATRAGRNARARARRTATAVAATAVAATAVLAAGLATVATPAAHAQTGCQVDYAVTGEWKGGFQASVTVTNLGSPLTGWQLTFGFPLASQSVQQGWGAAWSQDGSDVTAANETTS